MNKYRVTFYVRNQIMAAIDIYAVDEDWLWEFIGKFYPNTAWDYELIK